MLQVTAETVAVPFRDLSKFGVSLCVTRLIE